MLEVCLLAVGDSDIGVTTLQTIRWPFTALSMLNVTYIMPVPVLLSVASVAMQQSTIQNHIFSI